MQSMIYFFKKTSCESTIKMLALESNRFRYIVDCIQSEIFFLKSYFENMVKMWPPSFHLILNLIIVA